MNDLIRFFEENRGGLMHKGRHCLEIHDRHFARFRDREIRLLEFGVSHGGPLQLWKSYLGERAVIYGVDIDPACKALEEDRIHIRIGDQGDRRFLCEWRKELPPLDIVIDDGGHTMDQQIATFEISYPHVAPEGLYVCEDLHTSCRPNFGGGVRRRGTFIEHSKALIDALHGWHSRQPRKLSVTDFTKTTHSLHFYDSILLIEKRPRGAPVHVHSGTPRIPPRRQAPARPFFGRLLDRRVKLTGSL